MDNTIKIKGQIDFTIKDSEGRIKDSWTVYNSIMNVGFAQLALLAGDATAVPFTYIAVGTSNTAVAATQTTLGGETTTSGLGRAAGTVSRVTTTVTNDTLQVTKTWTASGTVVVEEVGVFNDASAGTMLARALTSTKTVLNTETLTATYKVKFA